jgi:hypothetical protein
MTRWTAKTPVRSDVMLATAPQRSRSFAIAAYGSALGFVGFTVPAIAAIIVIGLVAASGRSRRTLAKAAGTLAAALLGAAVVGFAIIIGIYVIPAAVALLVGSNLALQASGAQRRHPRQRAAHVRTGSLWKWRAWS